MDQEYMLYKPHCQSPKVSILCVHGGNLDSVNQCPLEILLLLLPGTCPCSLVMWEEQTWPSWESYCLIIHCQSIVMGLPPLPYCAISLKEGGRRTFSLPASHSLDGSSKQCGFTFSYLSLSITIMHSMYLFRSHLKDLGTHFCE